MTGSPLRRSAPQRCRDASAYISQRMDVFSMCHRCSTDAAFSPLFGTRPGSLRREVACYRNTAIAADAACVCLKRNHKRTLSQYMEARAPACGNDHCSSSGQTRRVTRDALLYCEYSLSLSDIIPLAAAFWLRRSRSTRAARLRRKVVTAATIPRSGGKPSPAVAASCRSVAMARLR